MNAHQQESGHIRLYRYFNAKWALKSIETAELRVSRLSKLNDPFEFMPALPFVNPMFSHSDVDDYMKFLLRGFDSEIGIICFSEQIYDPGCLESLCRRTCWDRVGI
jgi:hypothetical protein